MWTSDDVERLLCPEEFQASLTQVGGLNKYDEPNFLLSWGQTHTFRAGGAWEGDGFSSFTGYRDLLLGFSDPSWMVLQWKPAEFFGTPESYYVENYDQTTGLQTLGEYPYSGRYVVVFNLNYKEVVNGELIVHRMQPNSLLLDTIIPLVIEAKEVSVEQDRAARLAHKEMEEQMVQERIEDICKTNHPAFHGGAVSFSRQGVRSTVADKKAQQLSKNWQMAAHALAHGHKMSTFSYDQGIDPKTLRPVGI